MDWEMVAISGGPAKLMSHDSWLKLTAGPLPKQELALIKAEVDSTFEAFLRSKYGESHVVMFRDPFERPRLMKNLRDDIKTLHKGTGRDGSVFKTLFMYVILILTMSPHHIHLKMTHYNTVRLKKKLEALGLVKDRVLKVTRVRAFAKIPEDMLKAIEFGVYSKSDIEFWKEHTQLHVKVLLEEDGLGMHGAEAQRRVRKHLRDA